MAQLIGGLASSHIPAIGGAIHKGLQADPQLPYFIEWEKGVPHPSDDAHTEVTMQTIQIAGDPDRVREWLDVRDGEAARTTRLFVFIFTLTHSLNFGVAP